ncbi:hypothetical protein C1H46_008401 [Malus baccata]|uniref:Uncharacterized protein n=1 Tax=Malus baccata TaxID=106549 RepID=A0A540N4J2_MALBA|nr:hypothetical protein C1H46_008401 [Malus baccata]
MGVVFCVCAWYPHVDHRGMLRFNYESPSASSPSLPLSLLASSAKRRSSRRHPLAPTRLIFRLSGMR